MNHRIRVRDAMEIGVSSTTQMGTPVKSHTEKRIADYFTKNNVRYVYEPLVFAGRHYSKKIHPDFYLPDYDVYVEYWGLLDLPDNRRKEIYEKNMRWKMAQYHSRRIKFVSIYPENLDNLEIFPIKFEKVTGKKFQTYPSNTSLDAINLEDGSIISCRYCHTLVRKGDQHCSFCGKQNP